MNLNIQSATIQPTPSPSQRLAICERPKRMACMHQRWQALAFLHWRFDPAAIQALLPDGLTVDQHDGSAWLGLVPFRMQAIRPTGLPPLPWLSYFLETNLRTYVYDRHGRPGVWFFSLDCNQPIAVQIARTLFHLPYFHATIREQPTSSNDILYTVQRKDHQVGNFQYRFGKPMPRPEVGSLEFFLLERYMLFAWDQRRKQLIRGRVHHSPYPPCELELSQWSTLPIEQAGLASPHGPPDHCIASQGVQVEIFWIERDLGLT